MGDDDHGAELRMERGAVPCPDGDHRRDIPACDLYYRPVSGAWVDDNGPYAGINYVRSSNQGSTFTTPKRLNPSTQHGSRGSLAASGSYVYATWVSTTRWIAYQPTAPRVLYLRRGSDHGSSTGWGTIKRLTSLTGRVDFPTVAAAGANVYVAYTDSGSGSVRVR